MNCIIIDDDEIARSVIEELIKNTKGLHLEAQFSNAVQAIKYLNQNKIDLIFLDIHMPEFTGFDLIQTLKDSTKVILTSSDVGHAIDAFEYDCIVDYLVKPIAIDRFKKAIKKAQHHTVSANSSTAQTDDEPQNHLFVNIDRRLVKIDIPSISIIEAKGDYIYIRTSEKNYTVHSTLKKIEDKLPNTIFLKVHRSYIINTKKIIDIEDNSVLIEKEVIPVSRSNRPELLKRLNLL